MNVKEETPTEVEARLRAQIAATKENSVEEAAMQVDSEVCKGDSMFTNLTKRL